MVTSARTTQLRATQNRATQNRATQSPGNPKPGRPRTSVDTTLSASRASTTARPGGSVWSSRAVAGGRATPHTQEIAAHTGPRPVCAAGESVDCRTSEVLDVAPLASALPVDGGEADKTLPQAVHVADGVDQASSDPAFLVPDQDFWRLASEHGVHLGCSSCRGSWSRPVGRRHGVVGCRGKGGGHASVALRERGRRRVTGTGPGSLGSHLLWCGLVVQVSSRRGKTRWRRGGMR